MGGTHGTICWNELATRDVKAARDYYAAVCGWSFDESPMDGTVYTVARLGDRMMAGIFDMNPVPGLERMPPGRMTYLEVEDVDEAVRQTRTGGEVLRGPLGHAGRRQDRRRQGPVRCRGGLHEARRSLRGQRLRKAAGNPFQTVNGFRNPIQDQELAKVFTRAHLHGNGFRDAQARRRVSGTTVSSTSRCRSPA